MERKKCTWKYVLYVGIPILCVLCALGVYCTVAGQKTTTSLPPDAAYERLIAAFGTDESGQTQYPDDYAGVSITDDTLILYLTDISSKTTEKYSAWAGNADCLVFKEGECAYHALVQAAEPIVQSLQADGYTVAQYSVSETARRLSIILTACSEAEAKAAEAALRESWKLPIMVSVGTAVQLAEADAAVPAAVTEEAATPVIPTRATPAMSYAEYFSVEREYDEMEFVYEPDWIQENGYTILPAWMQEGGYTCQPDYTLEPEKWVLGLYDADGTRLTQYTDAPYLSWKMSDEGLYVVCEQEIRYVSYDGKEQTTLFSAPEGQILDIEATKDVLFFAVQTKTAITIYRLYVPEERLDVIYGEIPADAEGFTFRPVSNQAVVWSVYDPDFLRLAEEHQAEYQEKYQLSPEDTATYWGMLELDFQAYSAQRFYYNCATDTLRSQKYGLIYLPADRTEEDMEKNADNWWLDAG